MGLAELREATQRNTEATAELRRVTEAHGGRLDGVELKLDRALTDLGDLKGRTLEADFSRRVELLNERGWRKTRPVRPLEGDAIDRALGDGSLARDLYESLRQLDLLIHGREGTGNEAHDAYLAVEVSWTIDQKDVSRAAERAAILRSIGLHSYPMVAGKVISESVRALASQLDVDVHVEQILAEESS